LTAVAWLGNPFSRNHSIAIFRARAQHGRSREGLRVVRNPPVSSDRRCGEGGWLLSQLKPRKAIIIGANLTGARK